MRRILTLAILVIAVFLPSVAKNEAVTVWDHPCADRNYHNHDGYFSCIVNPTSVRFAPDTTTVSFEVRFRPDFWFQIASTSHLMADGKKYDLIGVEGIETDKQMVCRQDGYREFRLHFKPLPKGTVRFDFIEADSPDVQGAFNIFGITDPAVTARQLLPSTWRNEQTGDWAIGFFDEGVIYDTRFWDYADDRRPDKSSQVAITDGRDVLQVRIGKLKKGCRKINVGGREMTCSMITGRTLPDYPVKDTRMAFKDNGYAAVDTVIVRGWLRDMSEKLKMFSVSYRNIITNDYSVNAECNVDSLGRFELKVPLWNSTECFIGWSNAFIRTVLEPGETYYLFYDFGRGQKLFMGRDSRLQNELLAYPPKWSTPWIKNVLTSKGADEYLKAVDADMNHLMENFEEWCKVHPNMSERFRSFQSVHLKNMFAADLGQSRFYTPDNKLTPATVDYLSEILRNYCQKPYSLHCDLLIFLNDFVDDYLRGNSDCNSVKGDEIAMCYGEAGLSEDEIAMIDSLQTILGGIRTKSDAITDSIERAAYLKQKGKEYAPMVERVNSLMTGDKMRRATSARLRLKEMKAGIAFMDSLGIGKDLQSIWLTNQGHEVIDNSRRSLMPSVETFLCENITVSGFFDALMEENQRYIDLERRISNSSSKIVPRRLDVPDYIADGKVLLDSIIAPHKGKIVLLDVWGSWCGPCRAALEQSQKEYAAFAPYDVVYVYLANNTPEEAWRNIIEQYQVKGDNCFHYNLPEEQQEMIERYLNVKGYPSYHLFDREGNLLEINADPRDFDAMKKVLERL